MESTRNGRIGVIGTEATIGSGIYTEVMKKMKPGIQVFGKSCPLFVPLVEEGWLHDPVTDEIASRYLSILKERYIDTLVLGCTHYPLLRSTMRRLMGEDVTLVNPAYETAIELRGLLAGAWAEPRSVRARLQGRSISFMSVTWQRNLQISQAPYYRKM